MKLKSVSINKNGQIFLDGEEIENVNMYIIENSADSSEPAKLTVTMYVDTEEICKSKKEEKGGNNKTFKEIIYDENERLKSENANLLKEQEASELLLDLTLSAISLWGQQHGLIDKEEDIASEFINRHSKAGFLLDRTKNTVLEEAGNKIVSFLDILEKNI